jgi:hypothetical protein
MVELKELDDLIKSVGNLERRLLGAMLGFRGHHSVL